MKQITAAALLAAVLLLLLGGCTPEGGGAQLPEGVELVRAEVEREETAGLSAAGVAELVAGNNRLAFDLYHALAGEDGENLIFSPYSIAQAFSMVYGGAQGETAEQMAAVLHLLPRETQHPAFNALDRHLAALDDGTGGAAVRPEDAAGNTFRLNSANAVWVQEGYPLTESYLDLLARQYGAGVGQADFGEEQEAVQGAINEWVADATEGRIEQLAPPLRLSANTRLVLANAIYFKGSWVHRFAEEATEEGIFTLRDGTMVTALLMQGTPRARYYEGEDFQAVALPYWGNGVEMLVILPRDGQWQAVQEQLGADFVAELRRPVESHDVTLTMPRFAFDTTVPLKDVLQEMGMTVPFGAGADFGGMVEGGGLFIGDAVHKGTITVDEEGTEAAAVTGIAMDESEHPRAEMVVDHPFFFAIVERETGAVLFVGRVMNPAKGME